MLGILIVLLSMSSLAGASYKIGAVKSSPQDPSKDEQNQQAYNMALVVTAIAFMLALCGILMATTNFNPFANIGAIATSGRSSSSLGLL
jgi:hypothetical protein